MIGQPPVPSGQDFQYTLSTSAGWSRLTSSRTSSSRPATTDRSPTSRTSPAPSCSKPTRFPRWTASRRPRSSSSSPGSNALDTADSVNAQAQELEARFPKGLKYAIVYDTTPFIRESV